VASFEEVRLKVIEYLRDNGSANISELVREIGCGKQTVYDVVASLEAEGRAKSSIVRGKRIVRLTAIMPDYLKVLTSVTILLLLFTRIPLLKPSLVVHTDAEGCLVVYPSIAVFLLSIVFGFWMAVVVLKQEDLIETYHSIKVNIKRIIGVLRE